MEEVYLVAKDPKIWEQHPCKRYLRVEFDKYFWESVASRTALTILDSQTEKIIGSSRYKVIPGFPNGVEIGWTFLSRNYWGGTYNTAVKYLMMKHAFKYVDNIILYVDKNNIRSRKAVQKLGGALLDTTEYPELQKTPENNLTFVVKKALYQKSKFQKN